MSRLDRYIMWAVLAGSIQVAGALLALLSVANVLSQLEVLDDTQFSLMELFAYVLLRLPHLAYEAFPVAVLVGTLLGVGALSSSGELVAMRAAGVSVLRMARSGAIAGLVLGLGLFVVGEWIAPATENTAQELRALSSGVHPGTRLKDTIWIRTGDRFVGIERVLSETLVQGVKIYEFDKSRQLTRVISANRARIEGDGWRLWDVTGTRFTPGKLEDFTAQSEWLPVPIQSRILRVFLVKPESLSSIGLYRYISYLESNDLESGAYAALLWQKLTSPITVIVLVLMAFPFVFSRLREGGVAQRIVTGIFVGVAYYLFNGAVVSGGQAFGLHPAVATLMPSMVLAVVALLATARVR
ncbi:MAG: LPS export ABC transporter permease LptG [Pseudomonadota bacterium]|nr:LPS export ABC transporter permease LptG [Pseudomonadota bacterium]